MFTLGQGRRYHLYEGAADMRKGFDGLSGLVVRDLGEDPLSGDVFIFLNQRRDRVKLLAWEGDGFVLYYKRLERGTFERPKGKSISWGQLMLIMSGVELKSVSYRKRYRLPGKGESK